jgi:hypothetical protein
VFQSVELEKLNFFDSAYFSEQNFLGKKGFLAQKNS